MGIFFSNSNIKKLTKEHFQMLGIIADACNAETITEASEEERNEVKERCHHLKEQAQRELEQQKALKNSFV